MKFCLTKYKRRSQHWFSFNLLIRLNLKFQITLMSLNTQWQLKRWGIKLSKENIWISLNSKKIYKELHQIVSSSTREIIFLFKLLKIFQHNSRKLYRNISRRLGKFLRKWHKLIRKVKVLNQILSNKRILKVRLIK